MQIAIKRQKAEGNAIRGTMYLDGVKFADTLENFRFSIPCGSYPLSVTYSPKFRRMLPLVERVPHREGIRIHAGTLPEHSQGCILMDKLSVTRLISILWAQENKVLTIENE